MVNRRVFVQASAFGAGALALSAAFRSKNGQAQDSGTFVMGSLEEPGSLSALVQLPHHFPADVPQTLLFDSFTQFMPDSTVAPKLATSWEVSDDELTYTFHLNPDAKFHDDTPVTAHDVVFTFEAMLDPATNSSTEGVEKVASIGAIDDHTVVITLSAGNPIVSGARWWARNRSSPCAGGQGYRHR